VNDDLVVLVIIPLVTTLVQGIKQLIPEAMRTRLTTLVALACGVGGVAIWTLANGAQIAGAQAIAKLVLNGMATGLSATGLYHVIGDIKPAKEEWPMHTTIRLRTLIAIGLLLALALGNLGCCSAPQPKEFGGRLVITPDTGRPLLSDCPLTLDEQTRLVVWGDRHDEWGHKIPEPKS